MKYKLGVFVGNVSPFSSAHYASMVDSCPAKKKKRKAKVVKEFVVTWDTKLETSHMSESHVTQAFGLMQTRSITTPEGIQVSAKNCIQPALGRLARDIDKEHVAELMRLHKKEQKQGELWLERKQIRLICFFVMTCNCS